MHFLNQVLIDSWSMGRTADNMSIAKDGGARSRHVVSNCYTTQHVSLWLHDGSSFSL